MGAQSNARKQRRGEIVHRTKLFGGVTTAEEVHRQHGFRGRCTLCGGSPVIKVRMYMLHDEFVRRDPMGAAAIAATNPAGPYIPTVKTTFGPMVLFSSAIACSAHQKDLEHTAAQAPSWVLVEFDRGPGADRPIVAVPRGRA